MSGRYANKTCVDCGILRPANLMRRESRKVTSTIGGGISGNPFAKSVKASIRVSSARKAVRTKEVWVCGHRDACHDPDYYERIYAAQAEKARIEAERVAEQERIEAERVAEQERIEAEQAERDRIARETEEKIAGLSTEICNWFNSGKIKDKYPVDADKISDLKQKFEEKINSEYSKLPHLNKTQKTQFSDLVAKTINSEKLGGFLYESGSSISTPLVNALPSRGKLKKGFLWGFARLFLSIILFVLVGLTFLFLGLHWNSHIRYSDAEYIHSDADWQTASVDGQFESEIYAGRSLGRFLTLLANPEDKRDISLPTWRDLENNVPRGVEWERGSDVFVTQTSTPFTVKDETTKFLKRGYGGNVNVEKLQLMTSHEADFRSLLDILIKIESVEILDTRCERANLRGHTQVAIIETSNNKPFFVEYRFTGESGGPYRQSITLEILERSNKDLPVLGTSEGVNGVWLECNGYDSISVFLDYVSSFVPDISDGERTILLFSGTALSLGVMIFLLILRRGYSDRKISAVQQQINVSCDDLVTQSNALLAPALPDLVENFGNDPHFRSTAERIFGMATVTGIMDDPDFGKQKTRRSKPTLESEVEKVPSARVSTRVNSEENSNSVLKDAVAQIVESEDVLSLTTWILAKRVVQADGVIDESEEEWLQSELDLDASDIKNAEVVANDPKALQLAVLMFNKLFPRHPKKRELLINNLFALAVADGELAVDEEAVIRKIATMIKMKDETYQSMLDAMRVKTDESNPSILLADDIFDELEDLGDFEDENI